MAEGDRDGRALLALGYGLYVVTSHKDGRTNGQIANAVMQVTDTPPRLAAAVNKGSLTHEFIDAEGVFAVVVLGESAPMEMIRQFGFRSGRDIDKLAQVSWRTGVTGCPIVRDHALACAEVRVEQTLDCGTHTVFVGEVVGCRVLGRGTPMTYAYYREVLGGKTPPTAPTHSAGRAAAPAGKTKETLAMKKYVCDVCGYVYDPAAGDPDNGVEPGTAFEALPDDWVCPECGAAKEDFSPAE